MPVYWFGIFGCLSCSIVRFREVEMFPCKLLDYNRLCLHFVPRVNKFFCLPIEKEVVLVGWWPFLTVFATFISFDFSLRSFCPRCPSDLHSSVWVFMIPVSNLNTRQFHGKTKWSQMHWSHFDPALEEIKIFIFLYCCILHMSLQLYDNLSTCLLIQGFFRSSSVFRSFCRLQFLLALIICLSISVVLFLW